MPMISQLGASLHFVAATVRADVAGYVSALSLVYSALIVAWVVISWLETAQVGPGPLAPVFHFIDSVVEPFVGIFRRFIPPLGPVDLSPLVALLVVQIGGGILASLIAG